MDYFKITEVGWACLVIFWILSSSAKEAEKKEHSKYRFIVLAFYIAAALLLFTDYFKSGTLIFSKNHVLRLSGVIVAYAGLVLAIWARIVLGKNWSGRISAKKGHELIDHGPYQVVRNPIYSGILLAFIGTAITSGYITAYIAVILMLTGMIIKLKREEIFMGNEFNKQFYQYTQKVKYRLVPFIH